MKPVIKMEDIEWKPHPAGHEGVMMKVIRSEEKDETMSTLAWVKVEKGATVPKHIHADSDDYLYILEGKAKMRVGEEIYDIEKGSHITVPKGTEHWVFDVEKELFIYDIFSPPIF